MGICQSEAQQLYNITQLILNENYDEAQKNARKFLKKKDLSLYMNLISKKKTQLKERNNKQQILFLQLRNIFDVIQIMENKKFDQAKQLIQKMDTNSKKHMNIVYLKFLQLNRISNSTNPSIKNFQKQQSYISKDNIKQETRRQLLIEIEQKLEKFNIKKRKIQSVEQVQILFQEMIEKSKIVQQHANRYEPILNLIDKTNSNINQQFEKRIFKIQKIQNSLKELKFQANRRKNMNQKNINMLLNGEILFSAQNQKKFIIESIQANTGRNLSKTHLLYKFDPLNNVNFHRYIDGYSNWLLIIRLQNQLILGCYCSDSLESNMRSQGQGLLISAQNRQVYTFDKSKEHHKAVIYDKYYLIFGNSQVRIKTLEKTMFSNFGIINSFYGTAGKKLENWIGQSKREIALDSYEIYQLVFRNENL